MIQLSGHNYKFNIPTSWGDIKYSQWIDLMNHKTDYDILYCLTGIDKDTYLKLSDRNKYQLELMLAFTKQEFDVSKHEIVDKIDIREQTFEKKILLHELIRNNVNDLPKILPEVIAIYEQKETDLLNMGKLIEAISERSLIEVYCESMSLINQLKKLIEIEEATLSSKPNSDQLRAGVDMFNEFGIMNTVDALAQGNILFYEKVLKIEYNIVYLHLKMKKAQSIFQENYAKVLRTKRK